MSASFSYTPPSVSLARAVRPVGVFRYDPDAAGKKYQLMPNVRVLSIEAPGEGAHPGAARFRYSFNDPLGSPNDPRRFEQVYPLDATGSHVVHADDRLVVRAYHDDGSYEIMFDGFVQIPQADVGRESEVVSFQALGTPIREWDTPVHRALYRDGDDPYDGEIREAPGAPVRFNPDGQPNATPAAHDVDQGTETAHPVFLDHRIVRDPEVRDYWYLGSAAQYLVMTGNPDETYVKNPISGDLDVLLMARQATPDPDGPIDINNQSSYEVVDVECPDYDATGDPWPVALAKLIEPYGFGMRFVLTKGGNGDPEWTFEVYFKDDNSHIKYLGLQKAGADYDPAKTNVGELHLARDGAAIANRVMLDTAPVRYEACFVLAPGFPIAATDATHADDETYQVQDPAKDPVKATDWVTYRLFVFGEAGDPYWDLDAGELKTVIPSLNLVFGTPDDPEPTYARRRRPARGLLISKDERGDPRRAELYVTHDGLYTGLAPAVWKPDSGGMWHGNWQRVKHGGWELLEDQLGVRLTHKTVAGWPIDTPGKIAANAPFQGGVLNVVKSLADPVSRATDPNSTTPRIYFMLCCVVEGDAGLGVTMKRRAASPTTFEVTRHDDVRDRFAKHVVCASSMYSTGPTTAVLDETDKAKAHAAARRRQSELGNFSGTVTIPRLVTSYQVGDKISRVKGRGVSLVQNAAAAAGESDVLPTVVGVAWNFDGGQSTQLSLGDRRAAPPPEHRNPRLTAMRPES